MKALFSNKAVSNWYTNPCMTIHSCAVQTPLNAVPQSLYTVIKTQAVSI